MANDQSLRDHTGGPWGALRPGPTLIVSGAGVIAAGRPAPRSHRL